MFKRLLSWGRKTNTAKPSVGADGRPPWLDGYTGQTTDDLIGLADTHRVDSVILAFEEAIATKADRLGATLTPEEHVVLAVEAVEREVNNGGFDALFRNSSKEYARNYVSALQAIGRPDVAELAKQAIDALGLKGAPTVEAIDLALDEDDEARDEKLDELDQRYLDMAGDLAPQLLSFIKANRAAIVLPS
jgi:hypothetical protein